MTRATQFRRNQGRRNHGQGGYAYLLVMFLLALLIVGTMAVVPNTLTDGRREQEKEMIWRGEQYKRAIRLYVSHRTNTQHRLPTSLEVLVKGIPGVHFLRQAYKDPMNKKDGSWRLIYVGPTGQLIGSTRPPGQNLAIPGFGAAAAATAGAQQNPSSFNNSPNGPLSLSSQPTSTGTAAGSSQDKPFGSTDTSSSSTSQPEVPPDGIVLVGGNIIGVGSKVNQKSIIWFDKAKNYRQFEFIWDPSKDVAAVAQPATGAVLPGQPGGTSSFGNSFGQPDQTNPPANPPAPPPNPPGTGGGNPPPPPGTGGNPPPSGPPGTPPPDPPVQ
jgi:hypothetical protein